MWTPPSPNPSPISAATPPSVTHPLLYLPTPSPEHFCGFLLALKLKTWMESLFFAALDLRMEGGGGRSLTLSVCRSGHNRPGLVWFWNPNIRLKVPLSSLAVANMYHLLYNVWCFLFCFDVFDHWAVHTQHRARLIQHKWPPVPAERWFNPLLHQVGTDIQYFPKKIFFRAKLQHNFTFLQSNMTECFHRNIHKFLKWIQRLKCSMYFFHVNCSWNQRLQPAARGDFLLLKPDNHKRFSGSTQTAHNNA